MAINNLRLRCQFSTPSFVLGENRTMGTDSDPARASFHAKPSYPKEPCPNMNQRLAGSWGGASSWIASRTGSI